MSFGEATAVRGDGNGLYRGEIQEGWDILGVPNGGYLMSIAARAMATEAGTGTLVSVTGHFLNRGTPGPVEVAVETVKSGRGFVTMRAMMRDPERPLVAVTGSLARRARPAGDDTLLLGSPPDLPPPDDCERASSREGVPFPPPFVDRIDVRVHPDDAQGVLGRPSGSPLFRGWFRLLDDEPVDHLAVVLATDAFPPAVFNAGRPMGWTPTLDLTVHVRDPGPHEWLRCVFRTRFITSGHLEEDSEIWDAEGNLVAISRQLALVAR